MSNGGIQEMKIPYGIAEEVGFRPSMEDAHAIWDEEDVFSAEIYDGHGGNMGALLAAEFLTPHFLSLVRAERARDAPESRTGPELLRAAYLAADQYICSRPTTSGTAAATIHILDGQFLAANVGDSRVIIGTNRGAIQLTVDHKPDLPEERSRIEGFGGRVISRDVPRVEGMLAMSRALGDSELKPYVSSEPRIVEGFFGTENDFVVVACDGVWDVLTLEEVIATVREVEDTNQAAQKIVALALASGSTDNVSVIVVDLRDHTRGLTREKMEIVSVLDRAKQ
jgi:protein phosphatase 1L